MVLSETRGLWLSWIVREGIGWFRRLACLQHGPDLSDGYFPSNPSVKLAPIYIGCVDVAEAHGIPLVPNCQRGKDPSRVARPDGLE
jgi:hypothetical protein